MVVVKVVGVLIEGGVVVLKRGAVVFVPSLRVSMIGILVVGITIAVVVVSVAGGAVAADELSPLIDVMAGRLEVELVTSDEQAVAVVLLPPPMTVWELVSNVGSESAGGMFVQ